MEIVNGTSYTTEIGDEGTQYEQLLADIWVGVLLSLILLSCVCCMCSCLVYHKFKKWKRLVFHDSYTPDAVSAEIGSCNYDCEPLPSYTVASGLPSYEEAIQQLESLHKSKPWQKESKNCPPPLVTSPSRVSLMSCITTSVSNEKS